MTGRTYKLPGGGGSDGQSQMTERRSRKLTTEGGRGGEERVTVMMGGVGKEGRWHDRRSFLVVANYFILN
jgi:hypothetical protein